MSLGNVPQRANFYLKIEYILKSKNTQINKEIEV